MIDLDAIFCDPERSPRPVVTPSVPTNQEWVRQATLSSGRQLLYRLWGAGYTVQLVKSDSNPTGFVIIPIGPITPRQELLAEYEAHHDAAVMELVEACRACGIDPLHWHELVSIIVAKSGESQS